MPKLSKGSVEGGGSFEAEAASEISEQTGMSRTKCDTHGEDDIKEYRYESITKQWKKREGKGRGGGCCSMQGLCVHMQDVYVCDANEIIRIRSSRSGGCR